jgi:hypothetical protein
MAAIQQIQNLIALSQPIPPDLQVAALLEAQQQGLSSSALAGVFGVPESMIADSVSALGLSGQLSPNLGGTLAPATKFDNNVGVVSGRTAAAQESQPIELAPPALLPEGYGSTIDRPFSGVFSLPDINTLRGNVFDEDLEYQDAKELYQDIQEGLFSGATDSAGAVLKAIIDSMIASQNQAGTSAGNFPTTEAAIEALNNANDPTAGLINLTVGSNPMLSDADLAAAQATTQTAAEEALSNISAEGGFSEEEANEVYDLLEAGTVTVNDVSRILNVPQAIVTAGYDQIKAARAAPEETVDLTADTTANDLLTGGLGDADTGGVADVNETWTYNKATDSFISSTRGDSVRNSGNADLKDGGVYAVTPVLGTDGVMAENVVDTETNESVGVLNIDITTGLPSIIKTVDAGTAVSDTDTFGTAQDTLNTGQTLGVGDTTAGSNVATSGDDFNTAADTNNTGQVLTVGDTTIADPIVTTSTVTNTPTVINGVDGVDGVDGVNGINGINGQDGRDGQNGRDGRDGIIGLFSAIQSTPVTDSLFFEPKFTELDNVQLGMFERFLRAAGGRR